MNGNILVDIDGSVHDPKNKTTGITEFNDSKRPYQTDGYDAYIVKCYDDNITDSTNIISLKTNENMSLKQFMAILQFMNMSDEKIKDIKSQK